MFIWFYARKTGFRCKKLSKKLAKTGFVFAKMNLTVCFLSF